MQDSILRKYYGSNLGRDYTCLSETKKVTLQTICRMHSIWTGGIIPEGEKGKELKAELDKELTQRKNMGYLGGIKKYCQVRPPYLKRSAESSILWDILKALNVRLEFDYQIKARRNPLKFLNKYQAQN